MKLNTIIIAAMAVTLMTFASCGSDYETDRGEVALRVKASITDANTRLGLVGTSFAEGKQFVMLAGEDSYTYTAAADGSLTVDREYFFNTDKVVTFSAYYPADVAESIDCTEQGDALDILYDSEQAAIYSPEVEFTFCHKMSKLTFRFSDGGGMESGFNGATLTLSGFTTAATFSKATGELTLGDDKKDISIAIDSAPDNEGITTVEAIVPPQTEATFKLKLTVDGNNYTKTLTLTTMAGDNYIFPVSVSKASLSVCNVSIDNWTNVTKEGSVSLKTN
jgi:hypothetical protein